MNNATFELMIWESNQTADQTYYIVYMHRLIQPRPTPAAPIIEQDAAVSSAGLLSTLFYF